MKNTIKYYYNIYPDVIYQKEDIYIFEIDGKKYWLLIFNHDINELINVYYYLVTNNLYCHEIIYNTNNEILTPINNKKYILIKLNIDSEKTITLEDIMTYDIEVFFNKRCNWYNLWCKKIDFYEEYIIQNSKKYPLIKECINYYIGMAENAISLVKSVDLSKIKTYVNHDRLNVNTSYNIFYNPLNFTVDTKIRDISEYLKSSFFQSEKNILLDIEIYIQNEYLNNDEIVLFIARMIYPSYFFDLFDKIIENKKKESDIYFLLNKIESYEIILQNIIKLLRNKYSTPNIEWLIKT